MQKILLGASVAGLSMMLMAGMAAAGPIQSACLKSARQASNPQLCTCIQQVADITLGGSDQRLAATFFKDPERAQKVRMSQSNRDDAFWKRYVVFGQQAQMACAG